MIRAVVLDAGETLIDETDEWGRWADWLGVTRLTFFAVLGGYIERGEHHRRVFEHFRPGIDVEAELKERVRAQPPRPELRDTLYPDVEPALRAIRDAGYRVAIAGNIGADLEQAITAAGLGVDLVTSSASIGHEKPAAPFFLSVCDALGVAAGDALYVGDRLDTDVQGARNAGLHAALLRRGPWGHLQPARMDIPPGVRAIDSLLELPNLLADRA